MVYSLTETQSFEEWLKTFTSLFDKCYFLQIYNISANDKKKKTQQPPEENQMASSPDIKTSTGIKLEYLSEKINEFGYNHFFAVLDESPLRELPELEYMKKQFGNTTVNTT